MARVSVVDDDPGHGAVTAVRVRTAFAASRRRGKVAWSL
jgi:hypothetical protein